MFESFAKNLAAFAAEIPFDSLVWLAWGSFIAIFILALTMCLALPSVRAASKKPYLCLLYAYTAVTLGIFLTVNTIEQSAVVACIFWIFGYLGYGVLCLASRRRSRTVPAQVAVSTSPAQIVKSPKTAPTRPQKPAIQPGVAVRNNVRLEHAITVTNKLLEKNLGKTDRQELEKLKNTLEVLKVKGNLSPAEGEILNENFNALLKLMAKYNV